MFVFFDRDAPTLLKKTAVEMIEATGVQWLIISKFLFDSLNMDQKVTRFVFVYTNIGNIV